MTFQEKGHEDILKGGNKHYWKDSRKCYNHIWKGMLNGKVKIRAFLSNTFFF